MQRLSVRGHLSEDRKFSIMMLLGYVSTAVLCAYVGDVYGRAPDQRGHTTQRDLLRVILTTSRQVPCEGMYCTIVGTTYAKRDRDRDRKSRGASRRRPALRSRPTLRYHRRSSYSMPMGLRLWALTARVPGVTMRARWRVTPLADCTG